jgi:excinuclease UvrABC ATPase subunit
VNGTSHELPQPRCFLLFNNPFGACPCHGFGNIIELDMDLVADQSKSIAQNAIEP